MNRSIGRFSKSAGLIILIAFNLFPGMLFGAEEKDPLIGKPAPSLSGKNAIGRGLLKLSKLMLELSYEKDVLGKLKEVNGKYVLKTTKNVVVLNFFSTSCIPCIREIPTYNKIASDFKNDPVKLVYVNIDANVSSLKIRRFIARKRIKVPMMMPNQKEAIKKYDAYRLPRMVIIDRQGKIDTVITGFKENLDEELTSLIRNLL